MKYFIPTLVIASLLASPLSFAHAENMTSGNYKIQADSMNFAGDRSTSSSYQLEDTAGEGATGDQTSANNQLHAGYQQSGSSTPTVVTPPATTTTPTSGPGNSIGTSGGSSLSQSLPVNVLYFTATPAGKNIDLTWIYPQAADISSVRIVRSSQFFPNDISDGDIIFEGSAPANNTQNIGEVLDHDIVQGTRYYYAIFAKNSRGLYSSGVLAQAMITIPGQATKPTTPAEIFQNVLPSKTLNSVISALSLVDFDFIQDGIKINQVRNGSASLIPVDGAKNLTIQLAYDKVPEILKTIAITLIDPNDHTKVFTFLLRVNKDKTAYEATIAPLGRTGDYQLNAIILDYQNQGLKRINGDLRAMILAPAGLFLNSEGQASNAFYLLLVFLVLAFFAVIILLALERRKKKQINTPYNVPV